MTGTGGRSSGGAPSASRASTSAVPHRLQLRGAVNGDLLGQLHLGGGPVCGTEPVGGGGAEHPGDDLDMAQARLPGRERLGRGGQPGGKRSVVEPDTWADLLGGGDAAAGLEPLPAEQVVQRARDRLVAAFSERPAALQGGHRADREPVEPPARALAQRQDRQQLVVARARLARGAQLVDRLGEVAVRDDERALQHSFIITEQMFEYDVVRRSQTTVQRSPVTAERAAIRSVSFLAWSSRSPRGASTAQPSSVLASPDSRPSRRRTALRGRRACRAGDLGVFREQPDVVIPAGLPGCGAGVVAGPDHPGVLDESVHQRGRGHAAGRDGPRSEEIDVAAGEEGVQLGPLEA